MTAGWRYRAASLLGVASITVLAVAVANHPLVQEWYQLLPVVGHLPTESTVGMEFTMEAGVTTLVVVASLLPLYKPRPRRILDVTVLAGKRVIVALFALATLGYFDYTYQLPRSTMILAGGILMVTIPAYFVVIRRAPGSSDRTILVGDDPARMETILEDLDESVIGYVCPPNEIERRKPTAEAISMADGGAQTASERLDDLQFLGGLSRLDDVLIDHDVDTAVLVFRHPDRGEFFGALDTCYEFGVTAKVHRNHADAVLTDSVGGGQLLEIDLEPWDWQDYAIKRFYDVVFALVGLLVSAPLMILIAVAIKLDSPGPVLYEQDRTAEFGGTFTVYKFRTMIPEGESAQPIDDGDNDRITRVGSILRRTHLDELPQLVLILFGRMSVVGPRATWTDEEAMLEEETAMWRKRWFVKPGLTGLAQINEADSTMPQEKIRYDLEYIRRQSFWFDQKIVLRQIWNVVLDLWEIGRERVR